MRTARALFVLAILLLPASILTGHRAWSLVGLGVIVSGAVAYVMAEWRVRRDG